MDLTGLKFGRLTYLDLIHVNSNRKAVWKCLCDCGKYYTVTASNRNTTLSCGCFKSESSATRQRSKTLHREKNGYTCSWCEVHKDNSEFHRTGTGWSSHCKECDHIRSLLRDFKKRHPGKTVEDWIAMNRQRAIRKAERLLKNDK